METLVGTKEQSVFPNQGSLVYPQSQLTIFYNKGEQKKIEIVARPGLGNSAFGRPHFGPVGPAACVGLKEKDVPTVLGRFHESHGGLDGGVAGVDKDHDLVALPHEVHHLVVTDLVHVLPLLTLVFRAQVWSLTHFFLVGSSQLRVSVTRFDFHTHPIQACQLLVAGGSGREKCFHNKG